MFEFRDASWFCPEVYAVLKQHDWCLAIAHLTGADAMQAWRFTNVVPAAAGAGWGLESCPVLPCCPPAAAHPRCRADAKGGQKLDKSEGGWIGSLQPGPNPAPAAYPLDCCTWGVYVRFHGSEGQVRGWV